MSTLLHNEAPNSRWMVTPDLKLVRCLAIGSGGVPVNASGGGQFQAGATATSIETGVNLAVITFGADHQFRPGQLIQAPATASEVLRQSWLEVLTTPSTTTLTVRIPRGLTCSSADDADGEWTAWTRGDDSLLIGDVATGDDTGRYLKPTSLGLWVENHPALLAYFPGARRVLLVRKGVSERETLYFAPTQETIDGYVGKPRVVRVSVVPLSGVATASAYIVANGLATDHDLTTGLLTKQELEHTVTVSGAGPYFDGVAFDGAQNAFFLVAEFTRAFGTSLGAGAYSHAPGWVRPQASVTFPTFNGATVTFPTTAHAPNQHGFPVNIVQESNGALGPDVKAMFWALEGVPDDIGQIIASKETETAPTTFGHLVTGTGQVLTPVSLTRTGALATLTFAVRHQLISGMRVDVRGADQAAYNGDQVVTVVDDYQLSFPVSGEPATPATGSLRARLRYYGAGYFGLNLRDRSFWLYSPTPGGTWRSVSMDINRLIA